MKLHIENLHVTFQTKQPAAMSNQAIPQLGEKWPETQATYAGISLSTSGNRLVHLLLWDSDTEQRMEHNAAIKHAEAVNPAITSLS